MDAKTKEEIELLQELIDSPDTPQDEKELYRDTIKELKAEAEKAEKKPETKKEEKASSFKKNYKFPIGQVVWDKTNKVYGVVLNNSGNLTDGARGELRLDSDGLQYIFSYDKQNNVIGYNLAPYGSKDDTGNKDLSPIKKSAQNILGMSTSKEDKEYYGDAYKDLLAGKFDKKPVSTKTSATKKEAPKKLPVDADKMKAEIKERTGKTEEECEVIIAEYRQLREKSKKIEAKRLGKLDDEGKLIAGTKEKTAAAVIETAAENIKDKLEKQVDKLEKEAEKGDRTPEQIEARINKNLGQLSKEMTKQATSFIKGIQAELGKADKTEAKQFLMNVRAEIDELLSKFAGGGAVGNVDEMSDSEIEKKYDEILSVQILAGDVDEDEVEELSISEKREFLENYKDEYAEGAKINDWKNAKKGDSARVLSENKMGLIIKDYGRKFHLKFVDGSEKTYDASELEFYRFKDEYAGGGWLRDRRQVNQSQDYETRYEKKNNTGRTSYSKKKNSVASIFAGGGEIKYVLFNKDEDEAYESALEYYLNEGHSDLKAERLAISDLKKEFPRLKKELVGNYKISLGTSIASEFEGGGGVDLNSEIILTENRDGGSVVRAVVFPFMLESIEDNQYKGGFKRYEIDIYDEVEREPTKKEIEELNSFFDKVGGRFDVGGFVQTYNITQGNMSSSSVNPSQFAVGGSVEDQISYADRRIDNLRELRSVSNEDMRENIDFQIEAIEKQKSRLLSGELVPRKKLFGLF